MSRIDKERLQSAIKAAGLNPTALAIGIGRDKDFIRDFLSGRKHSLKIEDTHAIADTLGVALPALMEDGDDEPRRMAGPVGMAVEGIVSAGNFRDISLHNQDEDLPRIAFAKDNRFPYAKQYALKIDGDSMNELFGHGSYVICVNLQDSGLRLKEGMSVHVERSMMGGQLVETTVKEVRKDEKGRMQLYPRSSNPSHKPIFLEGNLNDEVVVKGVVIGHYNPVTFGL